METARHAGALRCACAGKERAREPTCMQVGPKPGQRKKKTKNTKKCWDRIASVREGADGWHAGCGGARGRGV